MAAKKSALALIGGSPVIQSELRPYPSIGKTEIELVNNVLKSGTLSGFYGSWCEEFWGGPVVKRFERAWRERFAVKHAISMNSATSCLMAAMGAIGVSPGDEVLVPPLTMSATVVAPLFYGGVPVFVDLEPDTFCLDPNAVRKAITSRTKAILVVNLLGHPARLSELMAIAEEHGLYLVEDNAQGPLAEEHNHLAGTIGHIGIFSLNYHKHIHTGEGGICITDDDDLALRLNLIRNHGENVVEDLDIGDITNIAGLNFRLTEMSAAIGMAQLENIDNHVERRESVGRALTEGTRGMPGLTPPVVRPGCRHVYYMWALRYDEEVTGVSRQTFSKALEAEGFPHEIGFQRPLYLLPLFQKKVAIGSHGFPFTAGSIPNYDKGICPVAERMYEKELIVFQPPSYDLGPEEVKLLITALRKVVDHLEDLREYEQSNNGA